jgi:hypothetical protein
MLRASLDLIPFGLEGQKRNLHTLEIINIGEKGRSYKRDGTMLSSYKARTVDTEGNIIKDYGVVVRNFDRTNNASVLMIEVLKILQMEGAFDG